MNFSSVFGTKGQESKPAEVQQAESAAAKASTYTQGRGKGDAKIIAYFTALGIAEADIIPKVTVKTFNQWLKDGRVVSKGQHGVSMVAYPKQTVTDPKTRQTKTSSHPIFYRLFHQSQTEERTR